MSVNMYRIPAVTVEQMKKIYRILEDKFEINQSAMRENTSRNLTTLIDRYFGHAVKGKKIAFAVGGSRHAAAGIIAALYLSEMGASVHILTKIPDSLRVSLKFSRKIEKESIHKYRDREALDFFRHTQVDLIIDVLLGYDLYGRAGHFAGKMIDRINEADSRVISVDLPSGLNGTSGRTMDACIKAFATLTLGLPKTGLLYHKAAPFVGKLFLSGFGVPPSLCQKFNLNIDPVLCKKNIIDLQAIHPSCLETEEFPDNRNHNFEERLNNLSESNCLTLG